MINNEIRLRKDMRVFKSVNRDQHRQNRIDLLNHIKALTDDYNANRLPDESPITVSEMAGQLERKC